MAQNTTTSQDYVADTATVTTKGVSRSELVLLGTFGSQDAPSALVRLPGGKVQTVTVGDTLNGGKVLAIATAELTLARNGTAQRLQMP